MLWKRENGHLQHFVRCVHNSCSVWAQPLCVFVFWMNKIYDKAFSVCVFAKAQTTKTLDNNGAELKPNKLMSMHIWHTNTQLMGISTAFG